MQQPFTILTRICANFPATEIASLAAKQIRASFKTMQVAQYPIVSGESGTMEQLVTATLGSFLEVEATSASGEQLIVPIGFAGDGGSVGVIETMQIARRPDEPSFAKNGRSKRSDHLGSTFGIGELIQDVLDEGAHSVLLGWEEPLARDAGFGMAQALGVKFFNVSGKELDFRAGASLRNVASIDLSARPFEMLSAKFYLMRSESIPAPKRTQQLSVDDLFYEQELARISEIIRKDLGVTVPQTEIDYSGSCIEFGASLFLNAEIKDGYSLAFELEQLEMRFAANMGTAVFFAEQLEEIASSRAPASSKQVMQWIEQYNIPTVVITNQSCKPASETKYRKKFPMIEAVYSLADIPLFFEPLAPDAPVAEQRRYFAARLEKLFMRITEEAAVKIKMRTTVVVLVCVLSVFTTTPSFAQNVFDDIRDILIESVLPGGYVAGVEIRTLIRSNAWREYRKTADDREATNAIYSLAYIRTSGNTKRALFASALGVLDHRTVPIRLPFGGELDLPLTLESDKNYNDRVSELPAYIYSDSVNDRDKLQHFFFSAYFKNSTGMNWLVKTLGNLVEIGEDAFVIGGANDPRDKHANADGIRFGAASDPNIEPSDCLTPNP